MIPSRRIFILIFAAAPLVLTAQEKGDSLLPVFDIDSAAVATARDEGFFSSVGKMQINTQLLDDYPRLLGQKDPIRAAKTMPGVHTNKESSTGLLIQGCDASHSMVSVNGAQVFCPDHLLGLFSAFITPHFDSMTLVTGGIDASFPDRLGGGLDLQSKPRLGVFSLEADVSLISSDLTLNIPMGKKATLMLSGRQSYINALYGRWLVMEGCSARYAFSDANATLLCAISPRDSIHVSLYGGSDHLALSDNVGKDDADGDDADGDDGNQDPESADSGTSYAADDRIGWRNGCTSFEWRHRGGRVNSRTALRWSSFSNDIVLDGQLALGGASSIMTAGLSYRGETPLPLGTIDFGTDLSYLRAVPVYMTEEGRRVEKGAQTSVFSDWKYAPLDWMSFSAGLRLNAYLSDSFSIAACPRASLCFRPWRDLRIGLHYSRSRQNLHQVTILNGGLPTEYWLLARKEAPSELGNSLSMSLSVTALDGMIAVSAECYRRYFRNLAMLSVNPLEFMDEDFDFASHVCTGDGRSTGFDLSVQKTRGRVKGYVSYTLSRSMREFPDISAEAFPSPFDRLHNLNAVMSWHINGHLGIGAAFTYISGTPYTSVRQFYVLGGQVVSEFGKFYGSRLPDNHRLDLSITYRFLPRRLRDLDLSLSVYNVYAHKNVQFLRYWSTSFMQTPVYYISFPLPSIDLHIKF